VPGLVFKLKVLGMAGASFAAAKVVGWLYTLFVVGATLALASRAPRNGDLPRVWLTILFLSTLRSPFLPQAYAVFPTFWLLTLVVAATAPSRRALSLALLAWAVLNILIPVDAAFDPALKALIALLPQAATIPVAVLAVRQTEEAVAPAWEAAPEPA
jgi:hypothetical protein